MNRMLDTDPYSVMVLVDLAVVWVVEVDRPQFADVDLERSSLGAEVRIDHNRKQIVKQAHAKWRVRGVIENRRVEGMAVADFEDGAVTRFVIAVLTAGCGPPSSAPVAPGGGSMSPIDACAVGASALRTRRIALPADPMDRTCPPWAAGRRTESADHRSVEHSDPE